MIEKAPSKTAVFYNIADHSDDIPITQHLDPFLKTLEIPSSVVKCAKRLDERKAGQNKLSSVPSRPRPIEVCLNSVFDKHLLMSNVSKLKVPQSLWNQNCVARIVLLRKSFFMQDLNW